MKTRIMEPVPRKDQFVCVLNKKVETPKLLNAIGHMAAGLVFKHRDNFDPLRFRDFIDKDNTVHPATSENGFIVLRAKNSNQIRTLRNKLIEDNVLYTDFTQTMVEGTYVDQQAEFDITHETDLEYFGICFFEEIEKAKELTKKVPAIQINFVCD